MNNETDALIHYSFDFRSSGILLWSYSRQAGCPMENLGGLLQQVFLETGRRSYQHITNGVKAPEEIH